jgi:hypothetical protein
MQLAHPAVPVERFVWPAAQYALRFSDAPSTATHSRDTLHPPPYGIILPVGRSFILHALFAIVMNGQMGELKQELLCHRQRSWQENYTPQSPTDKLLSHVRQC